MSSLRQRSWGNSDAQGNAETDNQADEAHLDAKGAKGPGGRVRERPQRETKDKESDVNATHNGTGATIAAVPGSRVRQLQLGVVAKTAALEQPARLRATRGFR